MADLRKPNLDKALSKASGSGDKKALRGGYGSVQDRVNQILRNHNLFLSWDRRKVLIANIRAGYISFEYLRDKSDRWQSNQRDRVLDLNRGEPDYDLRALSNGYSGVINRLRKIYTSRGLEFDEGELAGWARKIVQGDKKISSVRSTANRLRDELNPGGSVGDMAEDADEVPEGEYNLRDTVTLMFPFLHSDLVDAYVKGWEETGDPQQALAAMRESAAYDRHFPGNRLAPGQFAMTEADYVSYRTQAKDLMAEYNLPPEFYDTDEDFGRLIGNQVRLSQLEERIRKGYVVALQAAPEVREELTRSFGFGIGDLAAFWLDPSKGEDLLQRKLTEAQIRAEARTTGYGEIDLEDSEMLASYGVDQGQAREGFGALLQGRGLFEGLIGSTEEDIALQDQLGATFLGDAEQRERIRRRAESRVAAFRGGGGGATTQEGNLGLRESE